MIFNDLKFQNDECDFSTIKDIKSYVAICEVNL